MPLFPFSMSSNHVFKCTSTSHKLRRWHWRIWISSWGVSNILTCPDISVSHVIRKGVLFTTMKKLAMFQCLKITNALDIPLPSSSVKHDYHLTNSSVKITAGRYAFPSPSSLSSTQSYQYKFQKPYPTTEFVFRNCRLSSNPCDGEDHDLQ